MRIGVFVGSFNPVHKGHIKIANYILDNNYVDKLLMIPTGNYWDKNNLIDLKYRIDMLKYYETDKLIVFDKYNNLPYTYQLMRKLKKIFKDDELSLIIGGDNIILFDKWKNYKELLKYGLIIYKREDIDYMSYLNKLGKKDNVFVIDKVNTIDISSTEIRNNINNIDYLNKVVDKEVIEYIKNNKLYE